jgi:4-carboxymuconolactone decarboxylase
MIKRILVLASVLLAVATSCNQNQNSSKMNEDKKTAPRIQPMDMNGMQEDWLRTLERIPGKGLKGPYFPVNVLGTLMYNPKTMGSFLDFWVTSKLEMGLTVREQELVILRMGMLYDCNYVWKHHVPVAREFGVTNPELEAVRTKTLPEVFNPKETALLMLTDEMVNQRTVTDPAWKKWSGQLSPSEQVDLVSLVSQYTEFALLNNVFQIQVEPPLADIPGLHEPLK